LSSRRHSPRIWPIATSGKEIRKLNFGKRDTPLLRILRRTLRESREVESAKASRCG
jgi:hypothetical protein